LLFVANVEFMKGHLTMAVFNAEKGDMTFAKLHAGHPLTEHFSVIERLLRERDPQLVDKLKEKLETLPNMRDTSELKSAVQEVFKLLDQAVEEVVPEQIREGFIFKSMLINKILKLAGSEYTEAFEDEKLTLLEEYQDTIGFITRAETIYGEIREIIPDKAKIELDKFFKDLREKIDSKAPPETVKAIMQGIIHELEEITGVSFNKPEAEGPAAVVATIKELLEKLVREYESGKIYEAEELAIRAYLENYELIEDDVHRLKPELNEEIEIMLREELRELIKQQAPAKQVEEQVNKIIEKLEEVKELLREPAEGKNTGAEVRTITITETSTRTIKEEVDMMPWYAALGVVIMIMAVQGVLLAKKMKAVKK